MRRLFVVLLIVLRPSGVNAQVTNNVCVASDHSNVTCGNVTFQVDLTSPAAKNFVVTNLNRLVNQAVLTRQVSVSAAVDELHERWHTEDVTPILRRLDVLEEADEKAGALADQWQSDHDQEIATLNDLLERVLGLRNDTQDLQAKLAKLDERVKLLEGKVYLVDRHRVRAELAVLFEPTKPEEREWIAVGTDYRFPGRFVLAPGLSYLRLMSVKTRATVTEGDPEHASLATIDNVDARGHAFQFSVLLGWEFRVLTPYFGLVARHCSLTYRASGVPDQDFSDWEFPMFAGGELRLVGGLSVFGVLGYVWSPSSWSREYEFDLAGQGLKGSSRSDKGGSMSLQIGARYAFWL